MQISESGIIICRDYDIIELIRDFIGCDEGSERDKEIKKFIKTRLKQ